MSKNQDSRMKHPDTATPERPVTRELSPLLSLEKLERLEREATAGPWHSWRRGNCSLGNGVVVGQSRVIGPERPYSEASYWHQTDEAKRSVVMTDADADFVVALRNTFPSLAAELRALRAENQRLKNEQPWRGVFRWEP